MWLSAVIGDRQSGEESHSWLGVRRGSARVRQTNITSESEQLGPWDWRRGICLQPPAGTWSRALRPSGKDGVEEHAGDQACTLDTPRQAPQLVFWPAPSSPGVFAPKDAGEQDRGGGEKGPWPRGTHQQDGLEEHFPNVWLRFSLLLRRQVLQIQGESWSQDMAA